MTLADPWVEKRELGHWRILRACFSHENSGLINVVDQLARATLENILDISGMEAWLREWGLAEQWSIIVIAYAVRTTAALDRKTPKIFEK